MIEKCAGVLWRSLSSSRDSQPTFLLYKSHRTALEVYSFTTWNVTEFDWNLDLHIHQKLIHFGRIRFCLGGWMVWVAPETASQLFYYTKVTEFHLQCIHLPHKTLVTEFDWNLDLHIHQKLSHFGRLRFCLGGLMVWVAPETARTLFITQKPQNTTLDDISSP